MQCPIIELATDRDLVYERGTETFDGLITLVACEQNASQFGVLPPPVVPAIFIPSPYENYPLGVSVECGTCDDEAGF